MDPQNDALTYRQRLDTLRATKLEHARRKVELTGPRDADEQGNVPPPPELTKVVEAISGSGVPVKALILNNFEPVSNHPSGGFFGPKAVGENFRRLLQAHPAYVDPASSMAGSYMVSFNSYRNPEWNPDHDFSHLHAEQEKYGIDHGIGGLQHFCPDLKIGLDLGWGGLLEKVRRCREANPQAPDFYDGLEEVVLGMQGWMRRHGEEASRKAGDEGNPLFKENLEAIADICARLAIEPPRNFREACQWLVIFQAAAKMYNGSGEWGQLDELLRPFYERDTLSGTLSDEEAIFHIACLLLSETAYIQLGGPDSRGNDLTSPVSYLILEAVHRLKTPANIGVRVGSKVDPGLFRRGVEILLEDRMGFPKFVGDDTVIRGFVRNGYPVEDRRGRPGPGLRGLPLARHPRPGVQHDGSHQDRPGEGLRHLPQGDDSGSRGGAQRQEALGWVPWAPSQGGGGDCGGGGLPPGAHARGLPGALSRSLLLRPPREGAGCQPGGGGGVHGHRAGRGLLRDRGGFLRSPRSARGAGGAHNMG
jgi:formate C-acetyltransferase